MEIGWHRRVGQGRWVLRGYILILALLGVHGMTGFPATGRGWGPDPGGSCFTWGREIW